MVPFELDLLLVVQVLKHTVPVSDSQSVTRKSGVLQTSVMRYVVVLG